MVAEPEKLGRLLVAPNVNLAPAATSMLNVPVPTAIMLAVGPPLPAPLIETVPSSALSPPAVRVCDAGMVTVYAPVASAAAAKTPILVAPTSFDNVPAPPPESVFQLVATPSQFPVATPATAPDPGL